MKQFIASAHPRNKLIALSLFLRITLSLLIGFDPYFFWSFLAAGFFLLTGLIGSGVCIFLTIYYLVKKKPTLVFAVTWIVLTAFNFIPGVYYGAVGSMAALVLAGGPSQIVADGRDLILCENQSNESACDWPASIERLRPQNVIVEPKTLAIRKFGLGDFAGFIITLEGVNPPPGAVRIIDGMYWFSDG